MGFQEQLATSIDAQRILGWKMLFQLFEELKSVVDSLFDWTAV